MVSPFYNSRTSTTLTSLGVDIIEARLNRTRANARSQLPTIVNVGNVLKTKSYRNRGIDLVMHVKRSLQQTSNDVVTIAVSTSSEVFEDSSAQTILFETITNDAKRVRAAGDFMKTDARMWYYLSLHTATLYQFPTAIIRDWFKEQTNFTHDWFEPRTCDLDALRQQDPRWVVTGKYRDFDTECRSWGVKLPLADVLAAMEKATGKAIPPVDVLEEVVRVSHAKGVLVPVWNTLNEASQRRALDIVEKHKLTFDMSDVIRKEDITSASCI